MSLIIRPKIICDLGTEWLLEDTIQINTEDDVDDAHLEWVPKHDAQHILALAISDMVNFLLILTANFVNLLLIYSFYTLGLSLCSCQQ